MEIKLKPKEGDNNLWGYVDEEGKWVIKPKFREAHYFIEGFASVTLDYLSYGFIKPDGSWLVKPKFEEVYCFSEGFAKVQLNGKWGYIKSDGKWLVKPRFTMPARLNMG